MKNFGLSAARNQIKWRLDEAEKQLEEKLEVLPHELTEETYGFADGLKYALIVLDTIIELEGGAK